MTEKKDKRINEIIEAAINEFIEKGYENASMESIAKRSKLSKGGLYHHFKSKTEILYTVNVRFYEPVQEFLDRVAQNNSVVEGLCRYIDNYLGYWNEHKSELSLYFYTMNVSFADQRIMNLYKESSDQVFDFFEAVFKKGLAEGIFKKGFNPRAHAIAFISCLDGALGYVLIDPLFSIDTIGKEIQNIFVKRLL